MSRELQGITEKPAHREKTILKKPLGGRQERRSKFKTTSGLQVSRLCTPIDLLGLNYSGDIGYPGQYPYVRGIHATMYRGRLWTMRELSGFGTAEETNRRFRYLLKEGETGLSVAFDYPTLMGYDSDHAMARGEVGRCGAAVSSVADMETLFDEIPLNKVSTSMAINGPASVLLAMYISVAQRRGIVPRALSGTTQNDVLKEFFAHNLCLLPPEPSLKLAIDVIEYCVKNLPKWNPISISGYHIREAGANAVQELAFTLADGLAYVEATIDRGLTVDEFAPRFSFFFAAHNDLFEEIAKFRAARKLWAQFMRERFRVKKTRSMQVRMHVQTSGCSLTAQQPMNNIIRVTIQTLAAVIGGAQSLHTNSFDEVFALPSERAVRIALRTQQIVAHETGIPSVVDPLGGSFYLEALTKQMEEETLSYIDRIEAMGGMLQAIDKGFLQKEIADSAYEHQLKIEKKRRIVVGLNEYVANEADKIPLLRIHPKVEKAQLTRLRRLKEARRRDRVPRTLESLRQAAERDCNLMPHILDCVKAYCTLGEICAVFREVWGEYREPVSF